MSLFVGRISGQFWTCPGAMLCRGQSISIPNARGEMNSDPGGSGSDPGAKIAPGSRLGGLRGGFLGSREIPGTAPGKVRE